MLIVLLEFIISVNAESAFTLLFFSFLFYYSSVRFCTHFFYNFCATETIQVSKCISRTAYIFLFSTFYTFGTIQLCPKNFPHSSLWGFFQISFCYNLSTRSAIETVLKCSAF